MAYEEKPKKQDGIIYCCSCEPEVQKPTKKTITVFKDNIDQEVVQYWDRRCGLPLRFKDIDIYEAK